MTPLPALILAAPASSGGKTTMTLGLLRAFRRRGLGPAAAKLGPDYIDPAFHEAASGRPSVNLDGWAMAPARLARLIEGRMPAGLLAIEGVMGLFDGAPAPGVSGDGSAAALARLFALPVLLVVDAAAQARSAAALIHGFRSFDPAVQVAAVIFNRVGGPGHRRVLAAAAAEAGVPALGFVPRRADIALPSRHLGLVQARETTDLEALLDRLADLVTAHVDLDAVAALARPATLGARLVAAEPGPAVPPPGGRIALARDDAFAFIYPHLLADWHAAGAEVLPFSPLAGQAPDPSADAVWLPGGYPELHAGRLATDRAWVRGLVVARDRGAVIFGECGGYMALGQGLTDADGRDWPMAGLLGLSTSFAARRLHLGYRLGRMVAGPLEGRLWRGHEFHYATITAERGDPLWSSVEDATGAAVEGAQGLRAGRVAGSFLHLIAAGQSVAG
ncbi:cobyrinate a,c-diamide synthase [Tistrella mobilis]|uniref:cobyrinate a,c-diamide synthase n=1 Tax=Tistrella mobilis TaxID=171437 RepID=UPI00355710D5